MPRGLAQLAEDDTVTDEPRGVEPQALKDQAEAAIDQVGAAGWLGGDTIIEFGSPHGIASRSAATEAL